MTALNWVWPPLVLALAVWMFVRMRRALTGRGRWLLTPVIVVLGLTRRRRDATRTSPPRQRPATPTPPPARRYDVDGHRLHLDCHGQGSPTVVLFNGLGEISASWARITDPVGRDHPGVRLRPRRAGLERGRRRAPRTA